MSGIPAIEIVSESEIVQVYPDYHCSWEKDKDMFFKILHEFGLDVTQPIERQDGLCHRNRLNQVVICSRWVGQSRLDQEWLNSGCASDEAKDRATGNKLLNDLYRRKGMYNRD